MSNELTFKVLYNYIQTAERDDVGLHRLFPESTCNVKYALHIYNNLMQVNFTMTPSADQPYRSIGNFIFSNNNVSVYRVDNNEVADYSHPVVFGINESIYLAKAALGINGGLVISVLADLLNPLVNH